MYTKEKINDWLQRLIDAKTTVITLLGITTNETVLNVFWDEWSELEGKLRQCNIQTFGKSIPDIKKMLLPTLLLIFFSSCQTQQREQSITQYETQTAIEAIHNAEKDRVCRETAELLKTLRGCIKEAETDKVYKQLAQRLLITIESNNKIYGFGLEDKIRYHEEQIKELKY